MGTTMGLVGSPGAGEFYTTAKPEHNAADLKIIEMLKSPEFQNASLSEKKEMLKDLMRNMSEGELRSLTTKNPDIMACRDEVLKEKSSGDSNDDI